MDVWSDSFKGELDPVVSTDCLQPAMVDDEFHVRHSLTTSTMVNHVSNVDLLKRVALLESENERLRTDLENTRIELSARIAANEGLKGKIMELYVEMQTVVEQKRKLQNSLTDVTGRLHASEASAKWYQSRVHGLQANRKTLQLETDTYRGILHQRQRAIASINSKYKQLNMDYTELVQKHRKEKQDLEREIQNLKQAHNIKLNGIPELSSIGTSANTSCIATSDSPDISAKLESTEDEPRGTTEAELKTLEERLLGNRQMSVISSEDALVKERVLITTMEGNVRRCENERDQAADALRKMRLEMKKLKSENESLHATLLSSKQEQSQTENAIFQLRMQLTKMIARYKVLRWKNAEAETKLSSMQDVISENARLKTLSYEANTALIRKLRQEKRKVKNLENKLHNVQIKGHNTSNMKNEAAAVEEDEASSLQECLKQALIRNKDLQGQLKALTKNSSESIDDEGYGDNSIISSVSIGVSSPRSLDPVSVDAAINVLSRSKDFSKPVQTELDRLKLKLDKLKEQYTIYNTSIQTSY